MFYAQHKCLTIVVSVYRHVDRCVSWRWFNWTKVQLKIGIRSEFNGFFSFIYVCVYLYIFSRNWLKLAQFAHLNVLNQKWTKDKKKLTFNASNWWVHRPGMAAHQVWMYIVTLIAFNEPHSFRTKFKKKYTQMSHNCFIFINSKTFCIYLTKLLDFSEQFKWKLLKLRHG